MNATKTINDLRDKVDEKLKALKTPENGTGYIEAWVEAYNAIFNAYFQGRNDGIEMMSNAMLNKGGKDGKG